METTLQRYAKNDDSSLGLFFIDCDFECYILEDEYRTQKVMGETRIPAGRYQIKLRKEGGFHQRYAKKFPDLHVGMLHITNIPNFKYVLIHIGNDDDDTAGCLLTGNTANNPNVENGFIGNSTNAYKALYKKLIKPLLAGEELWINIKDEGQIDLS